MNRNLFWRNMKRLGLAKKTKPLSPSADGECLMLPLGLALEEGRLTNGLTLPVLPAGLDASPNVTSEDHPVLATAHAHQHAGHPRHIYHLLRYLLQDRLKKRILSGTHGDGHDIKMTKINGGRSLSMAEMVPMDPRDKQNDDSFQAAIEYHQVTHYLHSALGAGQ